MDYITFFINDLADNFSIFDWFFTKMCNFDRCFKDLIITV